MASGSSCVYRWRPASPSQSRPNRSSFLRLCVIASKHLKVHFARAARCTICLNGPPNLPRTWPSRACFIGFGRNGSPPRRVMRGRRSNSIDHKQYLPTTVDNDVDQVGVVGPRPWPGPSRPGDPWRRHRGLPPRWIPRQSRSRTYSILARPPHTSERRGES
jgi:hypothetical protein